MSENYDSELCVEKHRRVDARLNLHDKRLNDHSDRLDKLEQRGAKVDEKVEHLCDQIKSLVSTLKWGMGLLGASFLGLFIYLLELHLK
ncbi:hemolysin XhlA family protein [Clostridium tyrobutyricum]|uniref:hemolysin XhlA family protein n=1 Tax=Clostridium tyrobutyricum TaxID=1519 RepID=UPI001C3827DF|nr:hemolysin XhlA family protein [Clostridium tyrobutyricum]MBV4417345.1 hemolysin XhlA family protein [Clostridium tyrobutyricum]